MPKEEIHQIKQNVKERMLAKIGNKVNSNNYQKTDQNIPNTRV